jgi:nicotinamidase-related amidase
MPPRECLLVMDYQAEIVARYDAADCADRTAVAMNTARAEGTPVIFVQVGFRPGFPEVSPHNRSFSAARKAGRFMLGDPGTQIDARVAPRDGELVVTKHRVGAFWATELDQLLRAQDIGSLVLAGIATSGVVLSTVRDAADRDYELTVLADCCADSNAEVHRTLLEHVFPRQARVLTSADWIGNHAKQEQQL